MYTIRQFIRPPCAFFLRLLIAASPLHGQQVTQQWVTIYNGPTYSVNEARATAVDAAGNVVVIGFTRNASNEDYYTAKYAAATGALLWEQRYNGPGNGDDAPSSAAVDAAGNVVVTGSSTNATGNLDYYTAKYAAASGALLWEQRYNGPGNGHDYAKCVAVDSTGNVVVSGSVGNGGGYDYDYYTAKYAAATGALLWEQRYNGPGNGTDGATSLAVDSAGNVAVTGQSSNVGGYSGYYTAKYASTTGALLWEQRYNGPGDGHDYATSVAVDASGNVVVTGSSPNATGNSCYYTVKYAAATGALLWEQRYDEPGNGADYATSVAVDSAGNVAVTGQSLSNVGGNSGYYTAKYAAATGALLWEQRYSETRNGDDAPSSVAVDTAGNVVVTGSSTNATGNLDYYTAKYAAASGALLWEQRYNGQGNGNDFAGKLALTPDGGVVVAGTSFNGGYYAITTVKYAPAPIKAQITSPANGSALGSTSLPLVWNAGVWAASYYLYIGTSPGAFDIYSGDQGTVLNRAVTVPAGRKIYVTLWSLIKGAYQPNHYFFNSVDSAEADLAGPVNGSTLADGSLNLSWNSGTGVSKCVVWIGSAYGGYDLGAVDAGTATSRTFTVPQDGGPVYVTLWSLINGGYQAENYWFNTALPVSGSRQARITSPANTSTLGSATLNLGWDAGVGVTSYALWVGSTPNGYDLYSGLEGTNLSKSVAVPGDGRRIYVTLHSLISGAYQSNSYWFTAPTLPDGGAAQVTSPASGSTLADATLPLVWSSAAGATQYYIFAGSSPGGYDLYSGSQGTVLNHTLSGLPVDGRVIYVTLYSWLNGAWKQSTAWFTTANTVSGSKRALIASPANGTTLPGASMTFTWGGGVGATSYALWIGSSAGAYDLWSSAETLATTSRTVTLPTDGRELYVTLYSFIGGAWQGASYFYTASNVAVTKAAMTSPVNGSTFTGASQTFNWSASNSATMYALWIGRTPGAYDIYAGAEGLNLSKTVTTLPTDGSPVYVTLYSLIKGAWQSNEYIYSAALPP